MADYMFAEYNKSYRNFVTDLAGPVAGDVAKTAKLFAAGIRGELQQNQFEALRFAIRQVPGNNIWWAKPVYEHLFLDALQEHMSPGYTFKMDSRLENQGQKRIFPSLGVPNRSDSVVVGGE